MHNHWLHSCPNVDDHYGAQVTPKGKPCAFCGKEEPHDRALEGIFGEMEGMK